MKLHHYDHDGRARFVTFCTHKKLQLLTNNCFRKKVTESIDWARHEFGLKLLGYVIMPEHIHMVIVPKEESRLGQIIGELKRLSAKKILAEIKNDSLLGKLSVERDGVKRLAFWQRRCYDHNCRSDEFVWQKVNYCHYNPVKRGLVRSPEKWEWSSYRWYYGYPNALLEMDVAGERSKPTC
ncbi:MAG TPA: hypothetical protein ENO22_10360 [candidate division Zixibacteria bacterium]|nr:hypothetical protein [candidate division Zixibacteria bacterium]HEQ99729.1 hypothetical protein [candidate division Zixibacteria bacterium]